MFLLFSFSGRAYPFRVSVYTDENEVITLIFFSFLGVTIQFFHLLQICNVAAETTCENEVNIATHPGGITGFALNYVQSAC